MSMWKPAERAPDNDALARSAETEFRRVLELDANNTVALASMASVAYNQAMSFRAAVLAEGEEKTRKLNEAEDWYKRLAAVDPANKEADYSLGVIAWAKWYPPYMAARTSAGLKPPDPGPLPEPARQELKAHYSAVIEEGLANLDRALELDPQYFDAMAYKNLLIRERADLRDTKEEYAADVAVADQWVQKSLAAKKQSSGAAPAPSNGSPTRIRVGGMVQEANIVTKVPPVYPPLARQAGISGLVRFTVIIGKDGSMLNVQLVSGHPLLVPAAVAAVKQWVYRPTLLNGNPVEVATLVDVNFSLSN
jgi:TonB family protein